MYQTLREKVKSLKREYKTTQAFKKLFFEEGKLKPEAEIILAYLRDECGSKGELGRGGIPYFYDKNERFDEGQASFLLGKRRVFDLIVKHLCLNELQIFNLISLWERELSDEEQIENNIGI